MKSAQASETSTTETATVPGSSSNRFYSMDALRGFALLLGVVFHAAESFCPERYSWAIVDVNAHWIFDWFQNISHSFRMELFFLIAGFFAHLVYYKRGGIAFFWNRFNRIALPFMIGWFVFFPIFTCIWIWGAAEGGRMAALGIPEEYHSMPAPLLTMGLMLDPNFLKEGFSLLHLWFLHQLMVIYAGFLLLCVVATKLLSTSFYHKLTDGMDSLFKGAVSSTWKWLVFPVLTVPVLMTMNGWGVDTPNNSLIPHLPTTLLYGGFFIFGWLLHRQSGLLAGFGSGNRWIALLILGFALSFVTKFYGNLNDFMDPANIYGSYDKVIYLTVYAVMMWSLVFGFVGLFVRFANTKNETCRYIADSSYWIYLVHHIVIVPTQILFANVFWPAGLKYVLINAICFPILYLSYHYLVRFTWVGKWLNGKKHEKLNGAESLIGTPRIAD